MISSFTWVGTLAPPRKAGWPFFTPVGAGKMPACSSAVEFGSIMQLGMVLPGKGLPWVIPAGAVPPGQFLNKNAAATLAEEGTLIGILDGKAPEYQAVSGTVWFSVWP